MIQKLWSFLFAATAALIASSTVSAQSLSLAGEWRFALDRSAEQETIIPAAGPAQTLPLGKGIEEAWFKRRLADRIRLPGILQAQGYGDDIAVSTPWVLTLGDAWWKIQPASLHDRFSQPRHVEVPFLSQPPKHYLGPAWYQREIEIPKEWKGRHVTLFLERPHGETTAWLDDRGSPSQHSQVAPHVFDFGSLTPGRHRVTLRIDNRQLIRDPDGDGHALDGHSVSDALGASWNGVVGRIELIATSTVWIDEANVFPDIAHHAAKVKVRIGNATGQPGSARLSVGDQAVNVSWDAAGGSADLEVQLAANAVLWDEFHPALQHLTVSLQGGPANDSKKLTFGLREITHRDRDLLLNGKLINLRLTHFGGDFPLTGYPAMDVDSWKKIFRVCQDFGLNGMRFHSWCPPDAAFTAADELGFYLQPECGMWSPFSPGSVYTHLLEEDSARLLRAFGNHPSFILFSPSNEPGGKYQKVTPQWAATQYAKDPRRLYSAGTGWNDPAQVYGGAQYASLVRFDGGELRNRTGWFGNDYRKAVRNAHIPILAHEVGQWCAYPDFGVIDEFTGYLLPSNYDIFKFIAEQQGVLASNHALAWASGRFQLACYKEEIEANLRTPGLSGYQLLDLHDYLGQGTALIGVVDAFWKPKSYVTATEFRRFNNATVPLARLAKRTFTSSETFSTDVELYHFAEAALHTHAWWKIVGPTNHTVAHGEWQIGDFPVGKNIPLGHLAVDLSTFAAPAAYRLVVGLADPRTDSNSSDAKTGPVENDWNFWVYPAKNNVAAPSNVVVTSNWPEAKIRLGKGEKVLFVPARDGLDSTRCPPMKNVPVFWNIQMTVRPPQNRVPRFDAMLGLLCAPKHPALAEFPTEENCDWQWTPLVDGVRAINLDGAPRELVPIVASIDDWNRDWRLGVIFECTVGPGRLLVSAIDFQDAADRPGARQLRQSLLYYIASEKFRPTVALSVEQVEALWIKSPVVTPTPAHVLDPDLDDGTRHSASSKTL